jgi:hypothetical protein
MKFKEWLETTHPEVLEEGWKDWGKKVAIGGALLGAGLGAMNKMGQDQQTANPQAINQQADSNYHWNSEIGRYTVVQNGNQTIYKTQKGNFVRVPNKISPTGYQFVKI